MQLPKIRAMLLMHRSVNTCDAHGRCTLDRAARAKIKRLWRGDKQDRSHVYPMRMIHASRQVFKGLALLH